MVDPIQCGTVWFKPHVNEFQFFYFWEKKFGKHRTGQMVPLAHNFRRVEEIAFALKGVQCLFRQLLIMTQVGLSK